MGIEASAGAVAALLGLGLLVSLDGTSVGQVMVSRPIVAAPLAGGLLGSLEAGLLAGFVLELLYLPVLPVGGGRFPEVGTGGVTAGAAAAVTGGAGGLAAAVLLGVAVGALGGASIRVLRGVNGRIVPDPANPELQPKDIRRGHLTALGLDALRGAAVTAVGIAAALGVAPLLAPHWPLGVAETAGLFVMAAGFSLGIVLLNLAGARWVRLVFLGGGMAFGGLLALVLG